MFFKGVIIVAAIVLGLISVVVLLSNDFDPQYSFDGLTKDESQKIVDFTKQFVLTSPTFLYDGVPDSLELKIVSADVSNTEFLLEGKFKTLHTGFGNREHLDLPEDITPHTIIVSIVDEKIISAVIDNQWDELNQIPCNTAQC